MNYDRASLRRIEEGYSLPSAAVADEGSLVEALRQAVDLAPRRVNQRRSLCLLPQLKADRALRRGEVAPRPLVTGCDNCARLMAGLGHDIGAQPRLRQQHVQAYLAIG